MFAGSREEQSNNHVIPIEGFPPLSPEVKSNKILFICIFAELSTNIFQNCSKAVAKVISLLLCKCMFMLLFVLNAILLIPTDLHYKAVSGCSLGDTQQM